MIRSMLYTKGAHYLRSILTMFDAEDHLADSSRHELLLDILMEFIRFDRTVGQKIRDHVRRAQQNIPEDTNTARARFKIKDILESP